MDKSKNFWGDTEETQETEKSQRVEEKVDDNENIETEKNWGEEKDAEIIQIKDKSVSVPKTEEVELKKKNKRDLILIICIILFLVAAISAGTIFLYNSGNRKIYSLIDSGSYAVAYKEINVLHEKGQNVDGLALKYIEACMEHREYKRVIQILTLLSDAAYSDPTYFGNIVREMISNGKIRQAEAALIILQEKECMKEEIEKIYSEYN